MSGEAAEYVKKVKRATKMLLFKRHRQPGVKGWELKRVLGADYFRIIDLVNRQLENLDLQVKVVYETLEPLTNPSKDQLETARFYVTLREPLSASDMALAGWRIDDVAVLVVAVSYIVTKQGKAPRQDVEQVLGVKFPKRRIDFSLNRFIKLGYLSQDDTGVLYLDWRARAEIDQKMLIKLLLSEELVKT